jgi:hypothetical protein
MRIRTEAFGQCGIPFRVRRQSLPGPPAPGKPTLEVPTLVMTRRFVVSLSQDQFGDSLR